MLATLRSSAQEDDGFTLIELLVVIIIIGILAAIAIPVFLNQRKQATQSSITSDLRTVANEVETYYTDNLVYPNVAESADQIVIGTTTVALSKNNVALATTTGSNVAVGTFCLRMYNTTIGVGEARYYNSGRGGILPKGQTCGA